MIKSLQDLRGVYRHPKRNEFGNWSEWADLCCYAENFRRTVTIEEVQNMQRKTNITVFVLAWQPSNSAVEGHYSEYVLSNGELKQPLAFSNKLDIVRFLETVAVNKSLVVGVQLDLLMEVLQAENQLDPYLFCLTKASRCLRNKDLVNLLSLNDIAKSLGKISKIYKQGLDLGWWI